MSIRLLLADDHVALRQGLRMLLETVSDFEVVAETDSVEATVDQALAQRPDVVLMDLLDPDLDGLAATRQLHEQDSRIRVIIFSGAEEGSVVVQAVRAGAIGYLRKTSSLDVLVQTIRAAAAGNVILSAAASVRILQEIHAPTEAEHLTDRELEVLTCIATGMPNKAIAWKLRISEKTVKSHVSTILGKLGVDSRTQAALYATREGLLSAAEPATAPAPVRAVIPLHHQRWARRPYASDTRHAAVS